MTFDHIMREEASNVGEPEEASISEITGEGPQCEKCDDQAVELVDARDLCRDHARAYKHGVEPTGSTQTSEADK